MHVANVYCELITSSLLGLYSIHNYSYVESTPTGVINH